MDTNSKNERDLLNVVTCGTAIGFGCMLASLQALRWDAAGLTFKVSPATLAAFALGVAVAFRYWKIVFSSTAVPQRQRRLLWTEILLVLLGVGAFLYPLRFIPSAKLPEIFIGLGSAVIALSLVGSLLWMVKCFVESDEQPEKFISTTDEHE